MDNYHYKSAMISCYNDIALIEAYLDHSRKLSDTALELYSYLEQELTVRRLILHGDYPGNAAVARHHIKMLHAYQNSIYACCESDDDDAGLLRFRTIHDVLDEEYLEEQGQEEDSTTPSPPPSNSSSSGSPTISFSSNSSLEVQTSDCSSEANSSSSSSDLTGPRPFNHLTEFSLMGILPDSLNLYLNCCNRIYNTRCPCTTALPPNPAIESILHTILSKTLKRDIFIARARWSHLRPAIIPCLWGGELQYVRETFPELALLVRSYQETCIEEFDTREDVRRSVLRLEECSNWMRSVGGVDLKACFCAVRYTRNGVYDGDDEAGDSRMIDV